MTKDQNLSSEAEIEEFPLINVDINKEYISFYKVLKKTRILKGLHRFNIYEYRLINYLLAMNSDDRQKNPLSSQVFYQIDLRNLIKVSDKVRRGDSFKRYKESAESLKNKMSWVKTDFSQEWRDEYLLSIHYFQAVMIAKNSPFVAFQLTDLFVKELTKEKSDGEGFALIPLKNYFKTSRTATLKLMELAVEFSGFAKRNKNGEAKRNYSIQELKIIFEAEKYSNSAFLNQVVKTACDEINEKGMLEGLILSYTSIVKPFSRQIESIELIVSYPEGNDPEGNDPEGNDPEGNDPEGNDPEGNDPEGNDPEGNDPEGNDPEGNDPQKGNHEDNEWDDDFFPLTENKHPSDLNLQDQKTASEKEQMPKTKERVAVNFDDMLESIIRSSGG